MGDAIVDFISTKPELPLLDVETYRRCPGGSALNTAVVSARLGAQTAFCSALGDDVFGRFLKSLLEEEGIDSSPLIIRKGSSTGVAFASSPGGRPQFHILRGAKPPALLLAAIDKPQKALQQAKVFHLCSLFAYRFAPEWWIEDCCSIAEKAGTLLCYDPNVRPHAIDDKKAARRRIMNVVKRAKIVKMSDEDASWLFPRLTPEKVARKLLTFSAHLAIVTCGPEGAIVATKEGRKTVLGHVGIVPTKVKDTVGAGDAFAGGLLAALVDKGIDSEEALQETALADFLTICQFAAASSAAVCSAYGALAGIRSKGQVMKLRQKISA